MFTYDEVEPLIAEESPAAGGADRQAALDDLLAFVEDMRDREEGGREVHRRGGGHARLGGPAPGRGDRRPGGPGRAAARHRAAGGIGLGPARQDQPWPESAPDPAAPGGGRRIACRDDRRLGVPERRRGYAALAGCRRHPRDRCSRRRRRCCSTTAPAPRWGRRGGRSTRPLSRDLARVAPRELRTLRAALAARRLGVRSCGRDGPGGGAGTCRGGASPGGLRAHGRGRRARGRARCPQLAAGPRFPRGDSLHAPGRGRDSRARALAAGEIDAARQRHRRSARTCSTPTRRGSATISTRRSSELERGFGPRAAESAALVRGYWLILAPEYEAQRGGRRAGAPTGTSRRSSAPRWRADQRGSPGARDAVDERPRRLHRGAVHARGAGAPGGAADPLPRPGPDRVRRRHRGRAGDDPVRAAGGRRVHRRRRPTR